MPCLFTREPGGTEVGERIRGLLKDESLDMTDMTELLLFEAARRENTERVIIPALEAGKLVVADRYIDSTTAYQAFGRGLDRSGGGRAQRVRQRVRAYRPHRVPGRSALCQHVALGGRPHGKGGRGLPRAGVRGVQNDRARAPERFVSVAPAADKHATAAKIMELLEARGIV